MLKAGNFKAKVSSREVFLSLLSRCNFRLFSHDPTWRSRSAFKTDVLEHVRHALDDYCRPDRSRRLGCRFETRTIASEKLSISTGSARYQVKGESFASIAKNSYPTSFGGGRQHGSQGNHRISEIPPAYICARQLERIVRRKLTPRLVALSARSAESYVDDCPGQPEKNSPRTVDGQKLDISKVVAKLQTAAAPSVATLQRQLVRRVARKQDPRGLGYPEPGHHFYGEHKILRSASVCSSGGGREDGQSGETCALDELEVERAHFNHVERRFLCR